jgi:CDP-diacylglycerol--serine O-phosphatidyltransferase
VASFIAPEFIPTSRAPTPVGDLGLNCLARLPRIPDLLTTANLCCGVGSILLASQGQLTIACGLIFLAAVFDVFDGLAARALGGGTPLGAQLDSLADMVSFGVAPGMIVWFMSISVTEVFGVWVLPVLSHLSELHSPSSLWFAGTTAAVLIVASAWRLAKFNVDTRQSVGFLGLPTPANALFWASLPLIFGGHATIDGPGVEMFFRVLANVYHEPLVLLSLSIVLGTLMLSELPLPSLKFKHKGWKGNEVIFLLMGIGAVLALLYGILAVPLILIIYLLSPLWGKLFPKIQ